MEEGGLGLVHLASRGAAFRLGFIQRLLTGPADLVWRPAARAILERCLGLSRGESLFLMDLSGLTTKNLPRFYRGLLSVWGLFSAERLNIGSSLHWLLRQPVLHGSRFRVGIGPALRKRLCEAGVLTLGQVLEVCGPLLDNAANLAGRLGTRSVRTMSTLLEGWRQQLSKDELELCTSYCNGQKLPNESDPFPELKLAPVLNCDGCLLDIRGMADCKLSTVKGKTMYYLCVKVLNKNKLRDRCDTPWRKHLTLEGAERPEWGALYKPPLSRRVGDLQWRLLHGAVAVNAFVSVINEDIHLSCQVKFICIAHFM